MSYPSRSVRGVIFALAVLGSAVSIFTIDGWLTGELMDSSVDFRHGEFMRGARAIGSGHASFWFLCILAWVRKRPQVLAIGILALLVCGIGVVTIKSATRRGRPDRHSIERPVPSIVVRSASDLSFPSGDTAQAFSLAFVAAAYMPKAWCWVPLGIAALPGLQRVLAGRHFLSDALAGVALGLLSASLGFYLERRWRHRLGYFGRLRRPTMLAGLVLLIWGVGWFLEEGQAFASSYVPMVAIVIFFIKGSALARWTTGVALGPIRAGDHQMARLRAMRLVTALWMAMILLPTLLSGTTYDEKEAMWMHTVGLDSIFWSRLGNAIGWIVCAWLASRIGERLAGPRAGFLAAVILAASASISWVARWSGFELLTAATLLLGVEGTICSAIAVRPGDELKRWLAPPAFLLLVLATASVSESWWFPALEIEGPDFGQLSLMLLALLGSIAALLPWPLWFAWQKRRVGADTDGVERRLACLAIYIVVILVLSGASAEKAALMGAVPMALVFALWLRDVPLRGIVFAAAVIMALPVLWTSFAGVATRRQDRDEPPSKRASVLIRGVERSLYTEPTNRQMALGFTAYPGVMLASDLSRCEPR